MISTKSEIFDLISHEIAVFEADMTTGEITWASGPMERLFGYTLTGELEGVKVEALIPDRLRAQHVGHRTGYAANPATRMMGQGLVLVGKKRDSSEFPVEIILIPGMAGTLSNRKKIVVGIVLDMSTRVRP